MSLNVAPSTTNKVHLFMVVMNPYCIYAKILTTCFIPKNMFENSFCMFTLMFYNK